MSRSHPARPLVLVALFAAAVAFNGFGRWAGAAELRVRATDACAEGADLTEQVDVLLGRPLASVPGIDFDVAIDRVAPRRWSLRLDTIDPTSLSTVARRELTGTGCAELADVAAVAVAMAVRLNAPDRNQSPGVGHDVVVPTMAKTTSDHDSQPRAVIAAPQLQSPGTEGTAWGSGASVTAVGDAGALPRPGMGVALEGMLAFTAVRLIASGGIFPSQTTGNPSSKGGEFQFAFASLLGCWSQAFRRVTLLGCGGFEVGRLAGRGAGANVRPQEKAILWEAALIQIGGEVSVGRNLSLIARVGLTAPVNRPLFVLDDVTPVHQPSRLGARVILGFEFFL